MAFRISASLGDEKPFSGSPVELHREGSTSKFSSTIRALTGSMQAAFYGQCRSPPGMQLATRRGLRLRESSSIREFGDDFGS
jgi:hypothetical protein